MDEAADVTAHQVPTLLCSNAAAFNRDYLQTSKTRLVIRLSLGPIFFYTNNASIRKLCTRRRRRDMSIYELHVQSRGNSYS